MAGTLTFEHKAHSKTQPLQHRAYINFLIFVWLLLLSRKSRDFYFTGIAPYRIFPPFSFIYEYVQRNS